jgi:hypothetical protein
MFLSPTILNRLKNGKTMISLEGFLMPAGGSRKNPARANEPWWPGLASGDVFQSGGGPPHSDDAAAFATRHAVAPASSECAGPPALWPSADIANQRVIGFFPAPPISERLAARAKTRPEQTNHGCLG